MTEHRPLRVFLCHSSNDKPVVRELYQKFRTEAWIQPWLDEEELYPGQDWNMEIESAVKAADAIIVFLSTNSVTKEGYVQKEIKIALDYSDYKPEGAVFIIPVRLENCTPPKRLSKWQYADYFGDQKDRAWQKILGSLKKRSDSLRSEFTPPSSAKAKFAQSSGLSRPKNKKMVLLTKQENSPSSKISAPEWIAKDRTILPNGMEFMRIPSGKFLMGSKDDNQFVREDEKPQHIVDIQYDYWMARFPITNEFYNAYIKEKGISHPVIKWEKKKAHPVVGVSWINATEYCVWLNAVLGEYLPINLELRLPTEAEWEKAARFTDGREYPWGNTFDKNKCNVLEGGKNNTLPIGSYSPKGDSPFGCADMVGGVLEWVNSLWEKYPYVISDGRETKMNLGPRILRGGSYLDYGINARCSSRNVYDVEDCYKNTGFRVCLAPPLPK